MQDRAIVRCAMLLLVACPTVAFGPAALLVRSDRGVPTDDHAARARRAARRSPDPGVVFLFRPRLLRAFAPSDSANAPDDD